MSLQPRRGRDQTPAPGSPGQPGVPLLPARLLLHRQGEEQKMVCFINKLTSTPGDPRPPEQAQAGVGVWLQGPGRQGEPPPPPNR